MSAQTNSRVILNKYIPDNDFSTSYYSVDSSQPVPTAESLAPGQVLIKVDSLSIDPHLRFFAAESNPSIYRYELGEAVYSIGVGVVTASKSDRFQPGDIVRSDQFRWADYTVVDEKALDKMPSNDVPPSTYLAYIGVAHFGKTKQGETLLVSAASGAVGQIVVQLAKARGARVVGYVKSLGADAVINYKTCGDFDKAIKEAAPEGVDVYFDNVGGEFLDAVLLNLNFGARVVLCGTMSTNGLDRSKVYGVKNLDLLVTKNITINTLFYALLSGSQVETDFIAEVSELAEQGKIQLKMDVRNGLESAAPALMDQFQGKNFGKVIVKL
ncbi:NAD(P)-binding protein [Linderina pennispora]|uniref:NAD(P)-binding protein n=1 Tax=Linderina pennispora TaxID=61395 RepID=A0A1Y1W572_9FUNG|nr:NAD(P)-binding protein [Linderina pennispora]ORX68366.1 NAD(P)-binding protein [Linderina pennispora]